MTFQKEEVKNSKSHILYTNNYYIMTSRRYKSEITHVNFDKYKVNTSSMKFPMKFPQKHIKFKYYKYSYIDFYNKAFGNVHY